MSMFHVGQLVCCISESHDWVNYGAVQFPRAKSVYSIRAVGLFPFGHFADLDEAVWLKEIVNPEMRFWGTPPVEPGFWAGRFRPVKDTSIEVFRSLLSPIPEEVA